MRGFAAKAYSVPSTCGFPQLFARIHKQILFKPVLLVVKLFVAAAESDQFIVGAAFEDLAGLDDEDLVGTADGRRRWAMTKVVRPSRRRLRPS